MTRAALTASPLRNSEHAVQFGLAHAVQEANDAGEWLAIQRGTDLEVIELFESEKEDFLDGLSVQVGEHYKPPPTVHARCRLHRKVPDLRRTIGYLGLYADNVEILEPLFKYICHETIVTGKIDRIKRLLAAGAFAVQPLYYWNDVIVVRIEATEEAT
jgi:hypothetical protein